MSFESSAANLTPSRSPRSSPSCVRLVSRNQEIPDRLRGITEGANCGHAAVLAISHPTRGLTRRPAGDMQPARSRGLPDHAQAHTWLAPVHSTYAMAHRPDRPARCPSAGCWPNDHPAPPSPPTTGCPPCPPTPRCVNWSASPRSAGGSSTTTVSSRTASGWTTSKAAATSAGTATSPSPPSPRPSAPCSDSTQKPLHRPDPLRGPPRVTEHPGHLDRCLLDMRPIRPHTTTPPQDLTKPY